MNLLAIDTSSDACSVALDQDGSRSAEHVVKPREHTRILLPMIRSLLDEARLQPADLDAIVLGNGPGSFIGMRIGASVAQGIAFAAGIQIAPVSSLAAIALEAAEESGAESVAIAQDARMNEVYFGQFHFTSDKLPFTTTEECICPVGRLPLGEKRPLVAGAGWNRYPELLSRNEDLIGGVSDIHWPRASRLLPMGRQLVDAEQTIDPGLLAPAYLRGKVAEVPEKSTLS